MSTLKLTVENWCVCPDHPTEEMPEVGTTSIGIEAKSSWIGWVNTVELHVLAEGCETASTNVDTLFHGYVN